jgi:hypothetical protein
MSRTTPAEESPVRIAIVSTPRSGNTWLRGLLAHLFELEERSAHDPAEVDWGGLPSRCVLQIHWRRVEPFVSLLDGHGFRVVALARHPLDVLISALNYQSYTALRDGDAGPAGQPLAGATPRSPEFLAYACTPTPDHVLTHSRDWWPAPGVQRVRYEDLVGRAGETLAGLAASLGLGARKPIDEVVATYDMDRLRARENVWHYHYWQGRPGLWRSLIPAREARRIAAAHPDVFEILDYPCDPDEALGDLEADLNWYRLQLATMRRHLGDEQAKHRATRGQVDEARGVRDDALARLEFTHGQLDATWARLAETEAQRQRAEERHARELAEARAQLSGAERELVAVRSRLAALEGLGATALRVARGVHRVARLRPRPRSA